MSEPGTTAPEQTYPTIVEAPRSTSTPWLPDTRDSIAADQAYPDITPADPVVDVPCPQCGR